MRRRKIAAVETQIVFLLAVIGQRLPRNLSPRDPSPVSEYRKEKGIHTAAFLKHIQDLIEAATTRDSGRAQTAFSQLSETARVAYDRAYPLAKDDLVLPADLRAPPPTNSPQANARSPPANASKQAVEPGHDILTAATIPLNVTIHAEIANPSDAKGKTRTQQPPGSPIRTACVTK